MIEYGEPDALYLNDGQGHFTPVVLDEWLLSRRGRKALAGAPLDWGLTATFRDLNGDGLPDLYVCNDYWTPDRVWINDGQGHFRAIDRLALRHTPASSMGVDFADLNRIGASGLPRPGHAEPRSSTAQTADVGAKSRWPP